MIQNKIINREIEYWTSKNQYYNKPLTAFKPVIRLIDILSVEQNITEKEIIDFISGLCAIPLAKTKKQHEEIETLLVPVFKRLIDFVKSYKYQLAVVNKSLKGQYYNQNGLEIKLKSKADKILSLKPEEIILVTGKEESIDKAVAAFIKYWNNLLSSQMQKPKMTAPLLALCLYYLEEGKYIKGTFHERIDKTRKLLNAKKFKDSTIRTKYYYIKEGHPLTPLNPTNLLDVLELLDDFIEAKRKAKKDLQSFE